MCGIVGFVTDEKLGFSQSRKKYIEQAIIANTLRGDDGTGLFLVPHEQDEDYPEADWLKRAVDGYAFITMPQAAARLFDVEKYRCIVGHNRSATVGGTSNANTHPFQEGPITLVHNGTLRDTYGLPAGGTHKLGVDVDSHALCHNLAEHPYAEVIEKINGAFAMVWHDARDDVTRFIRNDERPLFFAKAKNQKTFFFASEAGMLTWILDRLTVEYDAVYTPKPGILLEFGPDGVENVKISEVPLRKVVFANVHRHSKSYNYDTFNYEDNETAAWDGYVSNTTTPALPPPATEEKKEDKPTHEPRVVGASELEKLSRKKGDVVDVAPLSVMKRLNDNKPFSSVQGFSYPDGANVIMHRVPKSVSSWFTNNEVWAGEIVACILIEGEPCLICHYKEDIPKKIVNMSPSQRRTLSLKVRGPENSLIEKSEWNAMTAAGCAWCEEPLVEPSKIDWVKMEETPDAEWMPLCEKCAADMAEEVDSLSDEHSVIQLM